MNKIDKSYFGDAAVGCLIVIVLLIISPALVFLGGWIGGQILKWVCGDVLANGFNALFGTDRFVKDMLPVLCGTLAVIGSYFKGSVSSSKE